MRLATLLLCLCLFASVASAQNYFPLNQGRTWEYQGPPGSVSEVVLGPTDFYGHSVTEVRSLSNTNIKLYYYSRNAEGDAFLHGTRESVSEFLYEPPVLILDMPLAVGKTWGGTHTRRHFQNGNETHSGTMQSNFEVVSQETAQVQAGEFECFAIQEIRSGFSFVNWYATDVGKVRTTFDGDELLELVDYDAGVPVEDSSWGAVKALYESR